MEYCLNKAERKLVKLQKKAEKCITREKAIKILNKATKYEGITNGRPDNHNRLPA